MTGPLVVRYDAGCPFCRRCARLLCEHAPTGAVRTVGVEGRLDEVEAELPDGRVLRGARATAEALWTLGGAWRAAAIVARFPGAELAYRVVAISRPALSRWFGDP